MPKLKNAKHERFCHEYMIDQNGTQAYIRAGYSEKGARVSATKLLAKANIVARIDELKAPILEKCEISTEWIVEKHKQIIKFALEKIEEGYIREGAALSKSLDALAKIQGSYSPDKVEHTGNIVKIIDFASGRLKKDD